jgi:DNA invertase Pin-like site-specific DNA recombinase
VRAAVYTRVGSNEQAEGYSLRRQREAVETYCKEQGWEVVEFIEDVDSGAYLERRGLDKVRDLVDLGEIDLVVAQDVDRFARDDGIIVALLKREFSRKGARLYALNVIKHKNNTINEEIQACERELEKLSEASKSLDQIISRKQMVLSLLNGGQKDDKGVFYIDLPNSDDESEERAKKRQRIYKDLGIKVFATREDSWVEIGGSSCYQNGNSS